jgi:hypothetical protein
MAFGEDFGLKTMQYVATLLGRPLTDAEAQLFQQIKAAEDKATADLRSLVEGYELVVSFRKREKGQ